MPPQPRLYRFAGEVRRTLLLAAPIVAGQLSSVLMTFVDTVLAGRHGATTLAGVAVGSAVPQFWQAGAGAASGAGSADGSATGAAGVSGTGSCTGSSGGPGVCSLIFASPSTSPRRQ